MPDSAINPSEHATLEQCVEAFEVAWGSNTPPSVIEFVNGLDSAGRLTLELLAELCLVDMEHRWRRKYCGFAINDFLGLQPCLRDYVRSFQHYAGLVFDSSQLAEEYRVRRLWGDAPTPDRFLAEFATADPQLLLAMRQIDIELAGDNVSVDPFVRPPLRAFEYDPRAPLPFADFTLHELIGAGGMGKVYRATQRSLGRSVAVKALAKSWQRDPIAVDRFVEEARTLARLHHPNIVGVHGLGRFPGGGYFLVMDYVAGNTLESYRDSESLTSAEAASIVATLAGAIDYAHSQGVVHCDLKPTNVLVASDGRLSITDFGFAELMHHVQLSPPNATERRGGTSGYTAPEWLEDESARPLPTIDVYGLGAILDKLLAGCLVVSTELTAIRDKAISQDPFDRFQSASEFALALARVSDAANR